MNAAAAICFGCEQAGPARLNWSQFTLTHGIIDECEVDQAEEQRIEFLESDGAR